MAYDAATLTLYVNTDGSNPGAGHLVEASTKTYGFNVVGLSNIVIDGFTTRAQNSAGVRLFNASSILVRNINSSRSASYGMRLEASTGPVTIEGCSVSFSASNGILVLGNNGSTLRANVSHDNGFHGISLQGSSSNLVTGNTCFRNAKPTVRSAAGIDVNAASMNNVIQANTTFINQDSGIQVYNGSEGNLVTRNISYRNGDHGFDTNKSAGTRYVSNTSYGNYKDGFSVEGGSINTFMANNIAVNNGLETAEFDLYVDELSVPGFFSDFDILYNGGPGQLVTADASGSHDRETGIASYRFDFGDGFVSAAQSSPIATHVYSDHGNYDVTVTVTDNGGHSSEATKKVQIKK